MVTEALSCLLYRILKLSLTGCTCLRDNRISETDITMGYKNKNIFTQVNSNWPKMLFMYRGLSDFQEEILVLLIKSTKVLTHGNLTDVSILDFPAFGSSISNFDFKEDDWKTQTNYEVYKTVRKLKKANIYRIFLKIRPPENKPRLKISPT